MHTDHAAGQWPSLSRSVNICPIYEFETISSANLVAVPRRFEAFRQNQSIHESSALVWKLSFWGR